MESPTMSQWFVRAERGKTELNLPITDQRSTTVETGSVVKAISFKSARDVAYACKENLINQGWKNVRVVRVDS
jgi:hypothetical protein